MEFDDLKHAQRERLIFLDQCLTWRGMANRRDLVERFGISAAQAALDFRMYLECSGETAPNYDPVRKTYLVAANHKPLVPSVLKDAFDTVLNPADGASAILPQPERRAEPTIIAQLFQAIKTKRALHIQYTSMTTGADDGQWIAPTRFTSDGASIHVRAYSYKHNAYRDYHPIRIGIQSSFETRSLGEPLPTDQEWNTLVRIWLQPKTGLSKEQAEAVRCEFGFVDKLLCIETRKALEFYLDRRWGLDQAGARLERVRTEYETIQIKI